MTYKGNQNEAKYAFNLIHQHAVISKKADERIKFQQIRLKEIKEMKQYQHKQGLKVLNVILKQIRAKKLMQAFSFINKYSIEQRIVQAKVEFSAEFKRTSNESSNLDDLKHDNVKILMLLKDSVSFLDLECDLYRQ